jgi:hypothetical protein
MGGQACVFYGAAQVSKDIALDAEVRAEQARDRDYWEPLRRELEQFRPEHRDR